MALEPETTLDAIRQAANVAATLRQRFVKTKHQSAILNKLLLLHEERNALAAKGALTKMMAWPCLLLLAPAKPARSNGFLRNSNV